MDSRSALNKEIIRDIVEAMIANRDKGPRSNKDKTSSALSRKSEKPSEVTTLNTEKEVKETVAYSGNSAPSGQESIKIANLEKDMERMKQEMEWIKHEAASRKTELRNNIKKPRIWKRDLQH